MKGSDTAGLDRNCDAPVTWLSCVCGGLQWMLVVGGDGGGSGGDGDLAMVTVSVP